MRSRSTTLTIPTVPYVPTFPNVIRACVGQFGRREFIAEGGNRYTYRDIDTASAELGLGLIASGVGKATRVGLLMADGADWVTAWWAAARAGALTVAMSTFFQGRELSWLLAKADIDTLLVQRRVLNTDYAALLEKALPGLSGQAADRLRLRSHPYLRRIVVWGDCDRSWATPGGPAGLGQLARDARLERGFLDCVEEQIAPSDLLIGICTSGSTAEPKIVMHTHGSVIRATHGLRPHFRVELDDRNYTGMPLFWVGGLNVNLLQVMYGGACIVFARSPRPDDVVDALVGERVTRLRLWPPQQAAIVEAARARGIDLGFVKNGLVEPSDENGKPVPPPLRSRGTMGMTETFGPHGVWAANRPLPPEHSGSAGQTLPGIERKIVDPDTGEVLPYSEVGELHVRGYPLMDGYYKRERSEVFAQDGFFPTGDLCALDDAGFVYFKSRRGEMVKTSGANVAPGEVEAALLAVGQFREAVVFGIPDARKGEKVVCVLVAADASSVDVEVLRQRMKSEISGYKVPAEFFFLPFESIPRSATGKPIKPKLKEMLASGELARMQASQSENRA